MEPRFKVLGPRTPQTQLLYCAAYRNNQEYSIADPSAIRIWLENCCIYALRMDLCKSAFGTEPQIKQTQVNQFQVSNHKNSTIVITLLHTEPHQEYSIVASALRDTNMARKSLYLCIADGSVVKVHLVQEHCNSTGVTVMEARRAHSSKNETKEWSDLFRRR